MSIESSIVPPEVISSENTPLKAPFNAILIHTYWPSRVKGDRNVPYQINIPSGEVFVGGLRNRLVTRAAGLLYQHSAEKPKIIIPGGKIKGPSYPSTSEITKKELVEKYAIPEEVVITSEQAYGTEGEIDALAQASKDYGWKKVVNIAWESHKSSIQPMLKSNMPPNVASTFQPVEDIINTYDNPHVQNLVKRINNSRYGFGFKVYESVKAFMLVIPGMKEKMYSKKKQLQKQNDDIVYSEILMHAIDKFRS